MSQSDNMPTVLVVLVIFAILILAGSVLVMFGLGGGLPQVIGGMILFAVAMVGLYLIGTFAKRGSQKETR